MIVVVIDDNQIALQAIAAMLRHLQFDVRPFNQPVVAIAELPRNTELVLSDVSMVGLDGFGVADAISLRFGVSPPRTLLMSGEPQGPRLELYPNSRVIGLMRKPIDLGSIRSIFAFLTQTRSCCPGVKAPICPHVVRHSDPPGSEATLPPFCETADYACCPHYETVCGRSLRNWITRRSQDGTCPAQPEPVPASAAPSNPLV